MAIRKEQGLFLLTLAFGYWMYQGITPVKKGAASARIMSSR